MDEQTTINIASISGGGAINVVPDACTFTGEVRSLDQQRAEELVAEVVERIHDAAHLADCDVDVDVSVEQTFAGLPPAPRGPRDRRGRGGAARSADTSPGGSPAAEAPTPTS